MPRILDAQSNVLVVHRFGPKESYMKFMNDFVGKESDNMRRFLANISVSDLAARRREESLFNVAFA